MIQVLPLPSRSMDLQRRLPGSERAAQAAPLWDRLDSVFVVDRLTLACRSTHTPDGEEAPCTQRSPTLAGRTHEELGTHVAIS